MSEASDRAALALTERFLRLYPGQAAKELESLSARVVVPLIERLPGSATALLDRLTPQLAAWVLEQMSDEGARKVLPTLDPGRAASLLSRLDEPLRDKRLSALDPALVKELRTLISFPVTTAGHLMETRMPTVRPDATAGEALDRLRGLRDRVAHHVYVVDETGRLVGTVTLQDLALASSDEHVRGLIRHEPVTIHSMAHREEVVALLEQRRLMSVPVVDFERRLLGVIRHDALVAAAKEEASADMQAMVGASREERALSPVTFAVRKRLPWLQINLGTAFLAAAVVGMFESTIAQFTALAVLLPVVAGQSGNTGAQALAVTMRGLALREVRPRHWARLTFKEANVALINGLAVALTTSAGVYVWSRSFGLALVIAVSMVISMVAAGLSGASIPVVLIALGQDPAQASSIILTTVTDVVGFMSFLGIATLLSAML